MISNEITHTHIYIYIYEESRAIYLYIPGLVLWVLTNWMGHMMSPTCGVYSFVIGFKYLRLTTNFCTPKKVL